MKNLTIIVLFLLFYCNTTYSQVTDSILPKVGDYIELFEIAREDSNKVHYGDNDGIWGIDNNTSGNDRTINILPMINPPDFLAGTTMMVEENLFWGKYEGKVYKTIINNELHTLGGYATIKNNAQDQLLLINAPVRFTSSRKEMHNLPSLGNSWTNELTMYLTFHVLDETLNDKNRNHILPVAEALGIEFDSLRITIKMIEHNVIDTSGYLLDFNNQGFEVVRQKIDDTLLISLEFRELTTNQWYQYPDALLENIMMTKDYGIQYRYWASHIPYPVMTVAEDQYGTFMYANIYKSHGYSQPSGQINPNENIFVSTVLNENTFTLVSDLPPIDIYELNIYNMSGQIVLHQTFEPPSQPIDIARLSNGMYIIQLINRQNKLLRTNKIIISR